MRALALSLVFVPLAVAAQYNIDSTKWAQSGLVDYSFSSVVYSTSDTDLQVEIDCSAPPPFNEDGSASTLATSLDIGALTGGQINLIVPVTGTLNPATGAFTLEAHQSGLNIPITVDIPDIGTVTLVLQKADFTGNFQLAGHDSCFIAGQWRDPGMTYATVPATTSAVFKGYIQTLFSPPWTLTVNNFRITGTKCDRPGASITGVIDLLSYSPGPNGKSAEVIVRNGSTTETNNVVLDAGGNYLVISHIPGTVEVLAKSDHWLRNKVSGVSTLTGSASGVNMQLTNGDVDNSNDINIFDLNGVLIKFGQTGEPEDLDGSGGVDIFDLNLTLVGFGQVGQS